MTLAGFTGELSVWWLVRDYVAGTDRLAAGGSSAELRPATVEQSVHAGNTANVGRLL